MKARLIITEKGETRATEGKPEDLAELAMNALIAGVPRGIKNKAGYVEAHGRRLLSRLADNGSVRTQVGCVRVQMEQV